MRAQGCRALVRNDRQAGPANVYLSPGRPQHTAGGSFSSVDSSGNQPASTQERVPGTTGREQAQTRPLAACSRPPRSLPQPGNGEKLEHHRQRELAPSREHCCSRSDRRNAGFMP
ncbi:hypothetical protein NDU88_004871 [Pleurodeles waltl]|uniref:Uncharacterized protein n=1 Tax=Pleurodeles waltl TaxID=8319 RepID=A0AAV7VKD2_PLEWA|nr:hypothetical protein NDU88_004871 [Pleurodeles waltl]